MRNRSSTEGQWRFGPAIFVGNPLHWKPMLGAIVQYDRAFFNGTPEENRLKASLLAPSLKLPGSQSTVVLVVAGPDGRHQPVIAYSNN